MKLKQVLLLTAIVLSWALYASSDSVFACFSTVGKDYYSDGKLVADGECYALVYTQPDQIFAGFKADGSVVDPAASEIVMILPRAKNGRCQRTLCVVPKAYADARKSGKWQVFLLDTRLSDGTPAGVGDGQALRVNGWGATKDKFSFEQACGGKQADGVSPLMASGPVAWPATAAVTTESAAVPEDAPQPRITGIRKDGEKVVLTVADTVPYYTYTAVGSGEIDFKKKPGKRLGQKKDGRKLETIELTVDSQADEQFFKVATTTER